ncbi:hypothetical protein DPMN_155077 [Dreissena polymorpha]|uniref:Uncharacterized protein n=1 Tax=Dreissena polymorpha TaxID=45954 RepID=A0A9D4JB14_DREPO|nr:hypothetical protein DPMN_155077 [Dreissena polymorpha]
MLAVYRNPITIPLTAVKTLETLPPKNISMQGIEVVIILSPFSHLYGATHIN